VLWHRAHDCGRRPRRAARAGARHGCGPAGVRACAGRRPQRAALPATRWASCSRTRRSRNSTGLAAQHRIVSGLLPLLPAEAHTPRDVAVATIAALAQVPAGTGARRAALRAAVANALLDAYEQDVGPGEQLVQAHCPPSLACLIGRDPTLGARARERFVADLAASLRAPGDDGAPLRRSNRHLSQVVRTRARLDVGAVGRCALARRRGRAAAVARVARAQGSADAQLRLDRPGPRRRRIGARRTAAGTGTREPVRRPPLGDAGARQPGGRARRAERARGRGACPGRRGRHRLARHARRRQESSGARRHGRIAAGLAHEQRRGRRTAPAARPVSGPRRVDGPARDRPVPARRRRGPRPACATSCRAPCGGRNCWCRSPWPSAASAMRRPSSCCWR